MDLLKRLLMVDVSNRFQNCEDVLYHPFFSEGEHHSEEKNEFADLARLHNMTPLDKRQEIIESMFEFRKLDGKLAKHQHEKTKKLFHLSTSPVKSHKHIMQEWELGTWSMKEVADAERLLLVIQNVLRERIQHTHSLDPAVRQQLQDMVDNESGRFKEVQKSIFDNLVVKVDKNAYDYFNANFPLLGNRIKELYPQKPLQSDTSLTGLFNTASRIRFLFYSVSTVNFISNDLF